MAGLIELNSVIAVCRAIELCGGGRGVGSLGGRGSLHLEDGSMERETGCGLSKASAWRQGHLVKILLLWIWAIQCGR